MKIATAKNNLAYRIFIIFIRVGIYGMFIFVLYTFFAYYKLNEYSKYIKTIYIDHEFEGKDFQEVIDLLGWPIDGIKHKRNYCVKTDSRKITYRGKYYGCLTYYSENKFVNVTRGFPFGGSKIFFDDNDKVVRFKEFMH